MFKTFYDDDYLKPGVSRELRHPLHVPHHLETHPRPEPPRVLGDLLGVEHGPRVLVQDHHLQLRAVVGEDGLEVAQGEVRHVHRAVHVAGARVALLRAQQHAVAVRVAVEHVPGRVKYEIKTTSPARPLLHCSTYRMSARAVRMLVRVTRPQ